MSLSPIASYKFKQLTGVSPEFLRKAGIRLLMLDLDNTIAPYGQDLPSVEVLDWSRRVREAGVTLFIVSNSRKTHRVSAYSEAMGIDYVYKARKPSPRAVRGVLAQFDVAPRSAALAGDQTYTDVLSANLAGVQSILVRPIKFSNAFLAVRYIFELPFRIWRKSQ